MDRPQIIDAEYRVDGRRRPSLDRSVRVLWLLSSVFIVYAATIPFAFERSGAAARLAHLARTTPWALHASHALSIPDVVQNVLLFVPFGALGVLSGRRTDRRGTVLHLATVVALGLVLSALVETLQLFTADRTSSITDLGTNTVGALLGGAGSLLIRSSISSVAAGTRGAWSIDVVGLFPALLLLAVVCLSAWEPFDVTLDVGTVGHKVKLLLHDPWQLGRLDDEGVTLLQAALFASALASWLRRQRVRDAGAVSAMAASAIGVALEATQAFVGARQPGLADALLRVAGAAAGGLWWKIFEPDHVRPAVSVAVATMAAATLQTLSPFQLADHYQHFQWVPFLNYYAYTTFDTLGHTFELVLLYVPLGFIAARDSEETMRGFRRAVVPALLIAIPLEYLQGWMVGRYADVTDIALSAVGAWAGAWAAADGQRYFAELLGRAPGRRSA